MKLDISWPLVFMLLANLLLFLLQTAVVNVAASEGVVTPLFYDYQKNAFGSYEKTKGSYIVKDSISDILPEESQVTTDDNSNIFTDVFSTIKNWFLSLPGVNYAVGVIYAVPNLLQIIGLPLPYTFAFSAFWHGMTVFLVLMLAFGR